MVAGIRGNANDPLVGFDDWTILIGESYETLTDGKVQAYVGLTGIYPRNRFLDCPPPIIRSLTATGSGGTIPAGNWFVSVAPYQGTKAGPPSNTLAIASPSTGKLTIGTIDWPEPPSGAWDGYIFMIGDSEQSMCQTQVPAALPSSLDITVARKFSGALQPNITRVRGKVKGCPWPGLVRGEITSVTTTTIVVGSFAGGGDAFTGRTVSVISPNLVGPWNFSCSSYDQVTGTFTVTINPLAAGITAGHVLVVLSIPSSVTATSYTDSAFNFSTDELSGYTARVLYGTGRGQTRKISSNTTTAITIEPPWTVQPDSTSVIIIEEPDWGYSADSDEIEAMSPLTLSVQVPTPNFRDSVLLLGGFGVDRFGMESPESATPMRLLYVRGEPFQVVVDSGTYTATADDRTILVDAATDQDIDLAAVALTRGNRIAVKRIAGAGVITLIGAIDGGATLIVDDSVILESDGTEYRSFIAGAGGGGSGSIVPHTVTVTADVTISYTVAAANTVLLLIVKMDATGGWVVDLDVADFGEQAVFDNAANVVSPSIWYSDGTKWRRLTEIWQH